MNLTTQPYKGARDFYPEDKRIQKFMFNKMRSAVEAFGYIEYDAPIIEPIEIYLAKSGNEIVNEQTYSFTDRGDREVVIRPEMTPTVSRMIAAKRHQLAYPVRWYSIPNLWRYERPQKGRYREHWQLNVDLFGEPGLNAEFEVISVAEAVLKSFGASPEMFEIRINSRVLIESLNSEVLGLNPENSLSLIKLIDRKNKIPVEEFITKAEEIINDKDKVSVLTEILNSSDINVLPESLKQNESFSKLSNLIDRLNKSGATNAIFDPNIMRGFDYYNDIVFEINDTHPENNRSMMGGGRYDGLVGLFGVDPVPTIGFGLGDATLLNFLTIHGLLPQPKTETDLAVLLIDDVYLEHQTLINELRDQGINVAVDFSDRKIGNKIRWAENNRIKYVSVLGEAEISSNSIKIKNIESGEQIILGLNDIKDYIKNNKLNESN